MRNFFLFIISAFIFLAVPQSVHSQMPASVQEDQEPQLLPVKEGEKKKYSVYIEIKKAYISGICILLRNGSEIRGSIFNEFGVSAIDFVYHTQKDKVKLHHVFKPLNRWYIKRMLRKNLLSLIHAMQQGESEYIDERHHITYKLKRLNKQL